MNKSLREQLVEKGLANTRINKSGTKSKRNGMNNNKSEQKEPLSERELAELMGVHRDIFKRVNGSVRRK